MRRGLFQQSTVPEVDAINFLPHIQIPVLMLNGRYDYVFPLATAQAPCFRALGTPAANKRHVLFDAGHSVPRHELIRDSLDWLDRHLGTVLPWLQSRRGRHAGAL
jgi:pimeloyl-ACP methyl ester carboxylesterase